MKYYLFTSLTTIFVGTLYIVILLFLLRREKRQNRIQPSLFSSNTETPFLVQDTCFNSPHEAIALFDTQGLLIHANSIFKQQFPNRSQKATALKLFDFFPEKMWRLLQEGLSNCQLHHDKVQQEFSINAKHFMFTFVHSHQDKHDHSLVFLFCKEFYQPSVTDSYVSEKEEIWNTILKLTNPEGLHSDWYNCFTQILPDLCDSLEADNVFLLDIKSPESSPFAPHFHKQSNIDTNNWLLSIPVWMNLLSKGEIIHNRTENFDPIEGQLLTQHGIKVLLLIPLIVNQKLLGIIGLTKSHNPNVFRRFNINNLRFIANILAMAISNQYDRSERDRLATVVEQSLDCIIIMNTRGVILYANPACTKITGFSPKEITGRSIKRLYTRPIRKELWQQVKIALQKGEAWNGQFSNYRKDKTLYKEAMLLSPVHNQKGKVVNLVIVKRDITEDKRLESIAEAANLMDNIGFIFSSIRHELGNPINSIKVSLSILESNLKTYDTEDIARFVHRSLSDIGRVEYLLTTLKNFSIFERQDIKATDMGALLEKLIQLTEKDLAKQFIMLEIHYPPQPLTGMVDPRAFLQVLLNLTTNAVAALEKSSNKRISIALQQKTQSQLTLIFTDNGCGMEKTTVQNLFRPFFTTKPKGTGLGLVIVKKMLSQMNCSIAASSQKGQGTQIEIIIPTH